MIKFQIHHWKKMNRCSLLFLHSYLFNSVISRGTPFWFLVYLSPCRAAWRSQISIWSVNRWSIYLNLAFELKTQYLGPSFYINWTMRKVYIRNDCLTPLLSPVLGYTIQRPALVKNIICSVDYCLKKNRFNFLKNWRHRWIKDIINW